VAFGAAADRRPLLATGSNDNTVREWDRVRKTALRTFLRRAEVNSLAVCGPMMAIGDQEGLASLNQIKE
jgi:hypothetical protein